LVKKVKVFLFVSSGSSRSLATLSKINDIGSLDGCDSEPNASISTIGPDESDGDGLDGGGIVSTNEPSPDGGVLGCLDEVVKVAPAAEAWAGDDLNGNGDRTGKGRHRCSEAGGVELCEPFFVFRMEIMCSPRMDPDMVDRWWDRQLQSDHFEGFLITSLALAYSCKSTDVGC